MKIKKISDYPRITFDVMLNYNDKRRDLDFEENNFMTKSKEFKTFDKEIGKKCNSYDYEYNYDFFSINLYGIKDVNVVKKFFKNLIKKGKITFGSDIITFKKVEFYGYQNESDKKPNIFLK